MLAYTVLIERRLMRSVRVAAASEGAARAMAGVLLRGSDRVVRITTDPTGARSADAAVLAAEALLRLCSRDFFDFEGRPQTVEDWLLRGAEPGRRDAANAVLALAGLRIMADGRVAIASPASVPTLHGWFRTASFDAAGLMAALASLPGATRANLTFAGCRSRAVILPFAVVVPAEARQGEDA